MAEQSLALADLVKERNRLMLQAQQLSGAIQGMNYLIAKLTTEEKADEKQDA